MGHRKLVKEGTLDLMKSKLKLWPTTKNTVCAGEYHFAMIKEAGQSW